MSTHTAAEQEALAAAWLGAPLDEWMADPVARRIMIRTAIGYEFDEAGGANKDLFLTFVSREWLIDRAETLIGDACLSGSGRCWRMRRRPGLRDPGGRCGFFGGPAVYIAAAGKFSLCQNRNPGRIDRHGQSPGESRLKMAGRPRKSALELLIAGTWRRDRHGGRSLSPTDPLGAPPAHLSPEQRRCWCEVAACAPWLRFPDRGPPRSTHVC